MSHVIPRRTFLKGMGTLMGLPLLEAMMPLSALASSPKLRTTRMAFLFVPNGMSMPQWTPGSEGVGFALPQVLEPLRPLQGEFSILTGLSQRNAFALGDGPGDHARSAAAWLTGVHPKKTAGADIKAAISADQVAAVKMGRGFIGIESEPRYFDIAARRISDELARPNLFADRPAHT